MEKVVQLRGPATFVLKLLTIIPRALKIRLFVENEK